MSRAALAEQDMSVAGLTLAFTAPHGAGTGNGNTFLSGGNTFVLVNNASGGTRTITVPNQQSVTVEGVAQPSHTQTIAAGAIGVVWVPPGIYAATDNTIAIDIDSATSVTWAAVTMPRAFQ